jgi:hypothetical protein
MHPAASAALWRWRQPLAYRTLHVDDSPAEFMALLDDGFSDRWISEGNESKAAAFTSCVICTNAPL